MSTSGVNDEEALTKTNESLKSTEPIEMADMSNTLTSETTTNGSFFDIAEEHFQELNRKHRRRRAAAACVIFTIYIALFRFVTIGVSILLFIFGNATICIFFLNQRRFIKYDK